VRKRPSDAENKLAAWIRQLLRARRARDAIAEELEAVSVCTAVSWLLAEHLESAGKWESTERWLDGLIGASVIIEGRDQVKVVGQMTWGLADKPGGHQWADPFEAQFELARGGISRYTIRFGDNRPLREKRIISGWYTTLADKNGKVCCRYYKPRFGKRMKVNNRIEPESGVWAFQFSKGCGPARRTRTGRPR
jgi:hypothetical protein